MSDNLKQLTQDVAAAINPAGPPNSILAVNHKNVLTQAIEKSGKYTGFSYKAKLHSSLGVVMPGVFVWNGNAMNEAGEFTITISKLTSDNNDIGHYLSLLSEGSLIHFKDFVGRSVLLNYVSHTADIDGLSNEIFNIVVTSAPENTNYTYQYTEEEICMIEFFNAAQTTNDYFKGVEIDLFWKGRGKEPFDISEFQKTEQKLKYIGKDPNNPAITLYKTFDTICNFLGIEIKNYDSISSMLPKIIIERYKRPRNNSTHQGNDSISHKSHAGYKRRFPNNDYVTMAHTGDLVYRPQIFNVTSKRAYYDIYAENYFSQTDIPKAIGNKSFTTFPKSEIPLFDDTNTLSRLIPLKQKGYAYCRIRLQITTKNEVFISPPLAHFKIVNLLHSSDGGNVFESIVKYQF